jgi:hypothetical protein
MTCRERIAHTLVILNDPKLATPRMTTLGSASVLSPDRLS